MHASSHPSVYPSIYPSIHGCIHNPYPSSTQRDWQTGSQTHRSANARLSLLITAYHCFAYHLQIISASNALINFTEIYSVTGILIFPQEWQGNPVLPHAVFISCSAESSLETDDPLHLPITRTSSWESILDGIARSRKSHGLHGGHNGSWFQYKSSSVTQPENVEFCKRHNVVVLIDRLQGPFEGNVLPLVYMRRGNYIVLKSFYTGVSVVLGVDVTFFNDFLRKSVGVQ